MVSRPPRLYLRRVRPRTCMNDLLLLRILLLVAATAGVLLIRPFNFGLWPVLALGVLLGAIIIGLEYRLRRASLKRLIGAAAGSILGILGAFLVSLVFGRIGLTPRLTAFLSFAALLVMAYVGLVLGAEKGDLLDLTAFRAFSGGESRSHVKLLDTSVIIDGRIANLIETGFVEGPFLVPQFVLHELQAVADSSDGAKRARGRRGLDVLQHLQKLPGIELQVIMEDLPQIPQVDHKLIALARQYGCKIMTNDFNLNKLAKLQQVEVLNVNEVANAVKPAVLPGESLRVYILKEGKEAHQGIGYLDDGTMVVVDHARRLMSRNVDVIVTSVLQTTAGKMIFGRLEERSTGRGVALSEAQTWSGSQ